MSSLLEDVKMVTRAVDHMAEACYVLNQSNDWVAHEAMHHIESVMDTLVERCKELGDIERFVQEATNAR